MCTVHVHAEVTHAEVALLIKLQIISMIDSRVLIKIV